MTSNSTDDDQQLLEKAVALRLLAEEIKVPGACLSDEEMAVLVDSPGKAHLLAKHSDHLCACRKCADEWLALSAASRERSRKPRIFHLPRARNLGYWGSALALAAGIAVYLNVVDFDRGVMPPVREEITREETRFSTEAPPMVVPRREFSSSLQSKSVKQVDPQPRLTLGDHLSVPIDNLLTAQRSSPVPVPDLTVQGKVATWNRRLDEACLSDQTTIETWVALRSQGQNLLRQFAAELPPEEVARLAEILSLLEKINDAQSATEHCEILSRGRS